MSHYAKEQSKKELMQKKILQDSELARQQFWAHGCMLPLDGRSFTCVQYFCDNIAKELDMEKIARHLEQADSIVDKCSAQKLLFSKTSIDAQIKP